MKEDVQTCNHDYSVTKYDDTYHWTICSKCQETNTSSKEKHNIKETTTSNTTVKSCTKCDWKKEITNTQEECSHNYSVTKYDDTYHWTVCSKCQEVKADSKEKHKVIGTSSLHPNILTCSECDWRIEKYNHDFYSELVYDDTYHWIICSVCGKIKENSKEKHNIKETTTSNTTVKSCTECDWKKEITNTLEECSHDYSVTKYDDIYHWIICSKCKIIKTNSKEKHNIKTSTTSDVTVNSCTACNWREEIPSTTECSHDYSVVKYDDTYHWEICSKCKAINSSNKAKHNIKETTTSNTIVKSCTACNWKKETTKPSTDSSSGKNNTTVNQNIPYAGSETLVGIVSIISIIGIAFFVKYRKTF